MSAVRVLVCDDQAMIRAGLTTIIDAQDDLEVVGECGDGVAAVELARTLRPDVVVMDIRMPGGSGIDACRAITAARPGTPVIMLTSHADSDALFDAICVCAFNNMMNRVVDAAGIVGTDAEHRESGVRLSTLGYSGTMDKAREALTAPAG